MGQLWAHADNVPWQFNMTNCMSSSSQGIVLIFKSSLSTVCPSAAASLWLGNGPYIQLHHSQLRLMELIRVAVSTGANSDLLIVTGFKQAATGWGPLGRASCLSG